MTKQSGPQPSPAQSCGPPVQLHVKAHRVNGKLNWGLGFEQNPPPGSKAEVSLPRKSGAREIVFHLVGSPSEISFDEADPVWVCETADCPPPKGSSSEQIEILECSDKKLRLQDKNEGPACVLTYQLNFVGAEPLDPMIKNGGSV